MQNFANPVFILIAGLGLYGLSACGLNSQVKVTTSGGNCAAGSIEASCAAESSTLLSLTGRRPLAIKSGDTVTLTGTGFNKAMTATIGGIPVTFLDVTSATSALLVVPPGVATGMSDLKLALTAAEATASVAYMPSSEMQLFTGSVSEICAGVEFYDLNGDKQTGTKSCSGSSSTPECTANGVVGCVTTTSYKSADLTNLSTGNIKSGITIAGITGNVTAESHPNCSSDGAIGCVVVGPTYAAAVTTSVASKIISGQSVAGVSGNITLPSAGKVLTGVSYGVSGTGSTGTLTIPAAGNVLSTAPAYGDPGAAVTPLLANKGSWDLATAFPGVGYYSGTTNTPAAGAIVSGSTIIGVSGNAAVESHSNCASDGATGCVAVGTYPAALATGAESKILSGQTLAGVAGNVTLPAAGKVYTGITYGVGGTGSTGTLTIPAAGNVLSTAPAYGDPGAQLTPSLTSQGTWNLTASFPGAGYYAAVSNSPTAATIAKDTTITGVGGTATLTPANCAADGATGCVAVGTYPAALATGAESKILSGQTLAGVAGNVTLPAAGKVYTGITYGVGGTGSTGTLTIPAAGNVLSTAPAYGDPDAQETPSLTSQGTWNLTASFPGAGYYAAVSNSPTAATIAKDTTIIGVAGTATLTPANCASNRATGCVTTDTYQSANLTNLSAGNIKSGITIAGQLGDYPSVTYKLPRAEGATADLADLDNATFDIKVKSATAFEYWTSTGSYHTGAGDADITQANIKDTVSIFGTVGNLTAAVAPDPWNVRVGVTVNGVTGKLKVNCRNAVRLSGTTGFFDNTTSPAAAGSDIWDTIDDYNGLPAFTDFPSSWSVANNYCGGVDDPNLSSDDDNVWKDVTTAGTGGASCADKPDGSPGSPERCTMQDKISGLKWSELASSSATWQDAITTCNGLTHNGQTAGSWRLPTQKELLDAYNHGITSAARTDAYWMTLGNMQSLFWSSSSSSRWPTGAWVVVLVDGTAWQTAMGTGKFGNNAVVCVQ